MKMSTKEKTDAEEFLTNTVKETNAEKWEWERLQHQKRGSVDMEMVKVRCPQCDNTWFTNIIEQKCIKPECGQIIALIHHKV